MFVLIVYSVARGALDFHSAGVLNVNGICLFRAETESTQFFQFDSHRNMYIFTPGAGCMGPTKLVRPGDEMIFNCSYTASDWSTDQESHEEKVAFTCPSMTAGVHSRSPCQKVT